MKTWTKLEVRLLHGMAKDGIYISEMRKQLDRTEVSIRKKLILLGYSRKTIWVRGQ